MSNELTPTNGQNVPAKRPPSPEQRFGMLVEGLATKELERIAATPEGKAAVARVALAFRAAAKSAADPSALYNCDPSSVASCIVYSAIYNLMPGGQFAPVYLVPKGGVLGWWMNHRGVIELARRSGYRVVAKPHYDGDEFTIEYGLNPTLRHVPGNGKQGWDTLVGVYVIVYDIKTGQPLDYINMTKQEIQARRNQAGTAKVWNAWPVEMAIKTAIKYAAARGVISLDEVGRQAMESDAETVAYVETTATPVAPVRQIASTEALDAALGLEPAPQREREPVYASEDDERPPIPDER